MSPRNNVSDFRVVACGERAVLHGADPYRVEPLGSCERAVSPEPADQKWSVTPFALPPYSAALLAPFGALNFEFARNLWFLLIVAATCVTSVALAKILRRSPFAVALVLAPTVGLLNLRYGETVPFSIAALAVAALALQRRAPRLAALATAAAMLEPAVGAPAVVALFILSPGARRPLAAFLGMLAAVSVAAFGLPRNLEYAFTFLPAHEHAELLARDQYSVTHLAYILGASPGLAAMLGSLSYAVAIVVGIVAARRLGMRMELPALYVLLPVAASMFGGPFVHDVEIAAALPAALVLARDSYAARLAVAFLAVDWNDGFRRAVVPALSAAAGVAALYLRGVRPQQRLLYVASVAALVLGMHVALPRAPAYDTRLVGQPVPSVAATDISSVPWEWHVRLIEAAHAVNVPDQVRKFPTWFALAALPLALLRTRVAGSRVATVARPSRDRSAFKTKKPA